MDFPLDWANWNSLQATNSEIKVCIIPKSFGKKENEGEGKRKQDFYLCFKKNGWCMKLKLDLLDEVMSRDEAFLCFLRRAAGRSVRLTFWPPRLLVKVPCQYLLFLHRAFSVWYWIHNPPEVTGKQQSLVWLTVQMRGSWAWGSISVLVVINQMSNDLSWSFLCSGSHFGFCFCLCPRECPLLCDYTMPDAGKYWTDFRWGSLDIYSVENNRLTSDPTYNLRY